MIFIIILLSILLLIGSTIDWKEQLQALSTLKQELLGEKQ